MTSTQDYEKLVNQIQQIKRTLNTEKLAHQATIDQLQVSYNLNKQLEEVIKSQANTINALHRQLAEKNNKLSEMTSVYQNQLFQLKQFVHVKDRQLQSIRGSLMVTDYDMIRLRIISQVELVHKQEVEQLNKQIERLNKVWNDQKHIKDVSIEKFEHVKKQLQKQIQKHEIQIEQKQRKHIREINKLNQRFQIQRMGKKQLQRLLESNQKKYQLLNQRYQNQISRISKQDKRQNYSSFERVSYEKQRKVDNLKINLQQKQMQIQSMKKRIQKQSIRYQQTIKDLEQKIKETKQMSIQYEQYSIKIKQKDKDIQQIINNYEKKIRKIKQDYGEQICKINKDNDRKIQQLRQKYRIEKQNYSGQINQTNINTKPQVPSQLQKSLQQQVKKLQKQKKQLMKQLQSHGQKNEKLPTPKFQNPRLESIEIYKKKLQQANKQIVNLLLEKASLKQKINKVAS